MSTGHDTGGGFVAMSKRQPSMRDVADAAKVSTSAVSLVVRGKPGIAPQTRERVWTAIEQLGYTVPASENGRLASVGLLIEQNTMPALLDIFYGDVIRGFQAEAQRLDYQVHLHMFDMAAGDLDGLYTTLAGEVNGLVLVENYLSTRQLPCVLGDNFTAGYTVMEHLLGLGHRSIAILRGPRKYSSLVDRLKGCLAAAATVGIFIPPEYIPHPVSEHPRKGYVQMHEILQLAQRPTAVVAISDKTAFGAMEAIKEACLRIPEDIAIVSIDDVTESAYTRPPLTCFHIPRADIGQLAMQKLHRLIRGEREVPARSIVYGSLVVRESCTTGRDQALEMTSSPVRLENNGKQ